MPRYDPHPVLGRRAAESLRLLGDPELGLEVPLPSIGDGQAEALVRAAYVHGTLSTAWRHIRSRASSSTPRELTIAFEGAEPIVLSAVGQAMRLRSWGDTVASRLEREGIRSAVIKGPVAAARLYPHSSDRFYTDVDIVIEPHAVERASMVLHDLAFAPHDVPNRDAADHCEFKFTLRSNPTVQIEVHTNLIHSSRLRQRISVDLDAILYAGGGDPNDLTSLLFVAGVHAAMGHQFERLELVIDVLQAVRQGAGCIDPERLLEASQRTGTRPAVAAALALAGRMYGQPMCTALARRLAPRATHLDWNLVSPYVVLMAQSSAGRRVAWRRKLFRQLVYWQAGPRDGHQTSQRALKKVHRT